MKAIDKIYTTLKQDYADKKLTTQQVADIVGLTRGVVSAYLSQLHSAGKLVKSGTRPVYWQVKAPQTAFDQVIGAKGSLQAITDRCLEAIVYPPNGFPLLITGPSGVGKSFFANIIFAEAKRLGVIGPQAKFVVLNAADYANNPELLSSILFGYKKGAFTGALSDKTGLIDQADQGYLFLDEVHRLPQSSQEKLFSLLDTGQFYPLGETSQPRKANVRFIFATTEKVEDTLLKTLLRRIPLQVTIPTFIERPLSERLAIVVHAFEQEAVRVQRPYQVAIATLLQLIRVDKPGNVGAVQNDVKLLCAAAYAAQGNGSVIPVNVVDDANILIQPKAGYTSEQLNHIISQVIDKHAALTALKTQLVQSLVANESVTEQSLLVRKAVKTIEPVVEPQLVVTIQSRLKKAYQATLAKRYGIKLPEDDDFWYVCALTLLVIELSQSNEPAPDQALTKAIHKRFPRSLYLFQQFSAALFEQPEQELNNLLFFPLLATWVVKIEAIQFNGILLAHGQSTAASIQGVVNNLCGNYLFSALDMSVDVSVKDISRQVQQYLTSQSASAKGTIVLFDMGSLQQMFTEIRDVSDQELMVVNNLTTAMALDIGLRIQRNDSFESIAKASLKFGETTNTQYYEGLSNQKNIIVSCMSGVGLSEEIKKMMTATLSGKLEITTEDYKDLNMILENNDQRFFNNTQFVITTTDIKSDLNIDVINIYDIMEKPGYQRLEHLLMAAGESKKSVKNLMDQMLRFFSIEGVKDRLQFMNPDIVIGEVQKITDRYQDYYGIELDGKIKLNLYMHLSLMIERMILTSRTGQGAAYQPQSDKEREFYSVSRSIFKGVEMKYNIKIEDYEISLMYQLLKPYI
ncbi:MAG: sigma 54-interacting transcriptional regulator [Lactobacillus sp.]|nr:sigma 54-interacting transcriptional regulator [Lactobacillus sp.]